MLASNTVLGYTGHRMKLTRKQGVLVISGVVVLLVAAYGLWQFWPRLTNPYYGLTTTITVQMDDATRALVMQKIATAEASIAAAEQSGADVDELLYFVIAENKYLLGDLVASREMYEKVLDQSSNSYVAWNAYANVLVMMKDFEPAEGAFKQALSLMHSEEYYRDYIEFLQTYYPERTTEVKTLLDEAYAKFGQTPWTMISLGNWYFADGKCDQGKAHYSVAATLAPETGDAIEQERDERYDACVLQE